MEILKSKTISEKETKQSTTTEKEENIPDFESSLAEESKNSKGNKRGTKTKAFHAKKREEKQAEEEKRNQPYSFLSEKTIEGIIQLPFKFISRLQKNNKWLLTTDEINDLKLPADEVIRKYVPSAIEQYGSELALVTILLVVVEGKIKSEDQFIEDDNVAS